ncbi:uncharacterized protein MONBRDRAFT_11647 [Monosiga brevicollis MX1]|uniref:Serine protease n=1 Tax=Monosiga brevicollis TaxID=81824 RepID=A9V9W0_MONBE|nr:uncharacterized protein MONBRDRAFT_11647 [Monosiga brevicollis MX1]EDQ85624.1 predicted protein [Monosiga brevicollis MX1]|eukprot:XP_001749573.1 hypothetical protein [Monosiga brevicollis MX1]
MEFGFVIESTPTQATIITNWHVIQSALVQDATITVTLADESSFAATIQHVDQASDLAILSVACERALPTAPLGSSAALRAGEWVVAIGSPLTLSNSISAGVVSNVRRRISDIGVRGFQRGAFYPPHRFIQSTHFA